MYKHGMYDTVGLAGAKTVSMAELKVLQAQFVQELVVIKETMSKQPGQFGPGLPAQELKLYRSHPKNLDGKPYMNHHGTPYQGSVCDQCERTEAGVSYHHHPLRCRRTFGRQCGEAGYEPEVKDPLVTFYIRGGKKGRMAADGSVTIVR